MCLFKEPVRGWCIHNSQKREYVTEWNMDRYEIEQSLVRSGKTQGGLVNITHNEWAGTQWVLTAHIVACSVKRPGSWHKMQVVLVPSSTERCIKAVAYGITTTCKSSLCFCVHITPSRHVIQHPWPRNISTGVVADHRFNVDDALNLGANIQEWLTGKDSEMWQ